jgi:hypothetical protein
MIQSGYKCSDDRRPEAAPIFESVRNDITFVKVKTMANRFCHGGMETAECGREEWIAVRPATDCRTK